MLYPGLFALVLVACVPAMAALARARWTWHAPRVAIVSWQALGLGLGLALIGLPLAAGLAGYGPPTLVALGRFAVDLPRGELPAGTGPPHVAAVLLGLVTAGRLLWVTGAALLAALRTRRHHRRVLALVARSDPAAPGALVLDHPGAAAYCLPGLRPTVVVSAGTLALLRGAELEAVLSHERAHAAERHDLVLLPFTALARTLPGRGRLVGRAARGLARVREVVALLVEMRADDRSRHRHTDAPLAAALRRFATGPAAGTPAGALGVVDRSTGAPGDPRDPRDPALAARVRRLTERHRRPPRLRGAVTLAGAGLLAGAPSALFTLPVLTVLTG